MIFASGRQHSGKGDEPKGIGRGTDHMLAVRHRKLVATIRLDFRPGHVSVIAKSDISTHACTTSRGALHVDTAEAFCFRSR